MDYSRNLEPIEDQSTDKTNPSFELNRSYLPKIVNFRNQDKSILKMNNEKPSLINLNHHLVNRRILNQSVDFSTQANKK